MDTSPYAPPWRVTSTESTPQFDQKRASGGPKRASSIGKSAPAGQLVRPATLDALAEQVRTWLSDGVEPEATGVAARVTRLAQQVKDRLRNVGVTSVSPTASGAGVRVGTMHAMKGLEFSCVAS